MLREIWANKSKRNLLIILVALFLIALVLVGLVIGMIVKNNSITNNTEDEDRVIILGDMTEEQIEEASRFGKMQESIRNQAKEYLKQGDVDKARELYQNKIDEYFNDEKYRYRAEDFIDARYIDFMESGYEEEALEDLISVDYDDIIFHDVSRHRYYQRIIDLAKKYNRSDIVAKFEELIKDTESAYKVIMEENKRLQDRFKEENE